VRYNLIQMRVWCHCEPRTRANSVRDKLREAVHLNHSNEKPLVCFVAITPRNDTIWKIAQVLLNFNHYRLYAIVVEIER